MGRQFFPTAGPLNDDLVADSGQPVQGAVTEDGVVEETQPLVHAPVVGDDEAGDPMATDDQLVEVSRLQSGEPVEAQTARMSRPRYIDLLERRPSGALTELTSL